MLGAEVISTKIRQHILFKSLIQYVKETGQEEGSSFVISDFPKPPFISFRHTLIDNLCRNRLSADVGSLLSSIKVEKNGRERKTHTQSFLFFESACQEPREIYRRRLHAAHVPINLLTKVTLTNLA